MKNFKEKFGTTKVKIIAGVIVVCLIIGGIGALSMPPTSDEMYMQYLKLEFTKEGLGSLYLTEFNGKGFWGWLEKKRVQVVYDKLYDYELGKLEEAIYKVDVENIEKEYDDFFKGYNTTITLKNNTKKDVKFVNLTIKFKDKYGSVVETRTLEKEKLMIPDGYTKDVFVGSIKSDWENAEVEISDVIYKE